MQITFKFKACFDLKVTKATINKRARCLLTLDKYAG